jgi:hypothetical protein
MSFSIRKGEHRKRVYIGELRSVLFVISLTTDLLGRILEGLSKCYPWRAFYMYVA